MISSALKQKIVDLKSCFERSADREDQSLVSKAAVNRLNSLGKEISELKGSTTLKGASSSLEGAASSETSTKARKSPDLSFMCREERECYDGAKVFLSENPSKLKSAKKVLNENITWLGDGTRPQMVPRFMMMTSKVLDMTCHLFTDKGSQKFNESSYLFVCVMNFRIFVDEYYQGAFHDRESIKGGDIGRIKAVTATYKLIQELQKEMTKSGVEQLACEALPIVQSTLRLIDDKTNIDFMLDLAEGDFTYNDLLYFNEYIQNHENYMGVFYTQIVKNLSILTPAMKVARAAIEEIDLRLYSELEANFQAISVCQKVMKNHLLRVQGYREKLDPISLDSGVELGGNPKQQASFQSILFELGEELHQFTSLISTDFSSAVEEFSALLNELGETKIRPLTFQGLEKIYNSLRMMPTIIMQSQKEIFLYTTEGSIRKWDALIAGPLSQAYRARDALHKKKEQEMLDELDAESVSKSKKKEQAEEALKKSEEKARYKASFSGQVELLSAKKLSLILFFLNEMADNVKKENLENALSNLHQDIAEAGDTVDSWHAGMQKKNGQLKKKDRARQEEGLSEISRLLNLYGREFEQVAIVESEKIAQSRTFFQGKLEALDDDQIHLISPFLTGKGDDCTRSSAAERVTSLYMLMAGSDKTPDNWESRTKPLLTSTQRRKNLPTMEGLSELTTLLNLHSRV